MIALKENVSLRHLNTFGVEAHARYFAEVNSLEELYTLSQHPVFRDERRLILGGGSNVLLTRDFDGLVVHVGIKGKHVVEEQRHHVLLTVGAGEVWHETVLHCIGKDWGGIENLSLIPGTVGAAPIQNIGAYGVELMQVIHSVDGVDLETATKRTLTPDECEFGYRDSVFKHALKEIFFISSITLRLTKVTHQLNIAYGAIREELGRKKIASPTIRDVSDAVIAIRRSKLPDPGVIGNAGSFFKNPVVTPEVVAAIKVSFPKIPSYSTENQYVKIPAGWLIEQCGWKGKRIGHVGVHAQQALVLVNYGEGTGEEIIELSRQIQQSVKQKFNIALTTEVNIV